MPLKGLETVKAAVAGQREVSNTRLRAIYLRWLSFIQIGTPVLEGRARNNWFLKVGSPSKKSTSRASGNSRSAQSMPKTVIGKKIYYVNNLPYINKLEYGGHSDQAPKGWVRTGLMKMRAAIRRASQ